MPSFKVRLRRYDLCPIAVIESFVVPEACMIWPKEGLCVTKKLSGESNGHLGERIGRSEPFIGHFYAFIGQKRVPIGRLGNPIGQ
jgi:hypothetical protein